MPFAKSTQYKGTKMIDSKIAVIKTLICIKNSFQTITRTLDIYSYSKIFNKSSFVMGNVTLNKKKFLL